MNNYIEILRKRVILYIYIKYVFDVRKLVNSINFGKGLKITATACYGLYSIDYAKMINAYFSRAYNIKDDCHFGKSFQKYI